MAKVKFNKDYQDKQLGRKVKADEELDMTLERADELVKVIQDQGDKFPAYKDFNYERLDKPKTKTDDEKENKEATKEGKK